MAATPQNVQRNRQPTAAWWTAGSRRHATAALALLGLGAMAKGPVAPALFAAAFGLFLLWQRDLRRGLQLCTPAGITAFVVLGLGWYALAWAGWGHTFVEQHLIGRYVRNLAGGLATGHAYSPKPWYFHLFFYPQHLPGSGRTSSLFLATTSGSRISVPIRTAWWATRRPISIASPEKA